MKKSVKSTLEENFFKIMSEKIKFKVTLRFHILKRKKSVLRLVHTKGGSNGIYHFSSR